MTEAVPMWSKNVLCVYGFIKAVFSYLLSSKPETIFKAISLDHHPFPIVTNDSISVSSTIFPTLKYSSKTHY